MIECEQCFCSSHGDCVNIPSHLASSFPFICPHCIKASITLIPSLRSEISHLRARVIKLENANKSSPNPEIMSAREASMSLSQHVDSLSCLSNSLPSTNSPIVPSSTISSSTIPSVSSVPTILAVCVSPQLSSVPSVLTVLLLLSQHPPSHNSKSSYLPQHFLSHLCHPCKPPFQPSPNCYPSLPSLKPPLLPTPQIPPRQPFFQPPPYCHPSLLSSKSPLPPTPQIPFFPNVILVPNTNPNVYLFLQSLFPLAPPSKTAPPFPPNLAQKQNFHICSPLTLNDKIFTSDCDKADILNKYFSGCFNSSIPPLSPLLPAFGQSSLVSSSNLPLYSVSSSFFDRQSAS